MPFELQVIRASEFVRLDPHEHLDFEASKQALQELAVACKKRGLDRALLDLRAVPTPAKRLFAANELGALVCTFREAGFSRDQRLAVLCQHDVHGGVADFAFISRMRGLQVQVFDDFEAAFTWLSEGRDKPEPGVQIPLGPRTKKIPINQKTGRSDSPSRALHGEKNP
jgi:hypothetical protein